MSNRVTLSTECEAHVRELFESDDASYVRELLVSEVGPDLSFTKSRTPQSLDRLRFAVLKLSEGSLDRFDSAIDLAKTDWRDLLMAAGFGEDIRAHLSWRPRGPAA